MLPMSRDVGSERLLEDLGRIAHAPLDRAHALPPGCYTDEAFFALEMERLFGREWICVGRASDIPEPGDHLTFELANAQVMAVRQRNGEIAVLSRVCRHRAALLGTSGGGSTKLFVCPYHKWVYELDGTLRGAPTMEQNAGFRRENCGLPSFRTEIWLGFIFFCADPAAAPLAPRLEQVAERVRGYDLADLTTGFVLEDVWEANWKVAFENSCETYHHMGVHPTSLEPIFPTLGARCEAGGPGFNLHVVPAIAGFSFEPATGEGGRSAQSAELLIIGVYPALVLVLSGRTVSWFAFAPVGVARTRIRVGWLTPKGGQHGDGSRLARDRQILEQVLSEDRASCAGVQLGLGSRDAASGPLSPLERTVAEFCRYLAERLSSGEGADPAPSLG